ncbi:MAG: hypothetical protein ACXWLG_12910 [Myxococcaceae bacterium]
MRLHRAVILGAVAFLGCAPAPPALRADAWAPTQWMGKRRQPPDCAAAVVVTPESSVGDRVTPAPGKGVVEPGDLGAGDVRQVWASTVGGVGLNWVAPLPETVQVLWALRVVEGGRCVVGTWGSLELIAEVIRHVFARQGALEIVLLGLGPTESRGWMVLVTDGSRLWSGLDSRDGRPGAALGQRAEFREEGTQLRLVVFNGGGTLVLDFDGNRFRPRP